MTTPTTALDLATRLYPTGTRVVHRGNDGLGTITGVAFTPDGDLRVEVTYDDDGEGVDPTVDFEQPRLLTVLLADELACDTCQDITRRTLPDGVNLLLGVTSNVVAPGDRCLRHPDYYATDITCTGHYQA
jgi:hypothetical protein